MASMCSEGLKLRPPTSRVDEGASAGRTPREPRLQQNGTNLQLIANASCPSPYFSFPDPPRIATNCKSLTRRQDRIVLSRFAIDCKFRSSGTCLREGDLSHRPQARGLDGTARSLRRLDQRLRDTFASAGTIPSSLLRMSARSSRIAAGGWPLIS
jgi:hypothetical protein